VTREHLHSGKVRDLYALSDGRLLMVASDRISAFDFVLDTEIPDKGEILTRMSLWWFGQLTDLVPHHVLSTDVPQRYAGRAVVCARLEMFPVECVARGYLTGSGLTDYRATGSVCGVPLPPGLLDGSELPEPIFTPTTKAPVGEHDLPMTYDEVVAEVGAELADELRRTTIEVYARGAELAAKAGILLADTKVELGHDAAGKLTLGDEVLTPDSSRFWPVESYAPGRAQPSYDKQYVRDWLTQTGWDKSPPAPELPADVVERTREKYIEAYELLTGSSFDSYLRGV